MSKSKLTFPHYVLAIMYFISNIKHLLLLLLGDTEVNPGPKRSPKITFCHWSLTGLAAHDCIKIPLVKAFIASKSFDTVCLSETFLDPTIPNDVENIQIKGKS